MIKEKTENDKSGKERVNRSRKLTEEYMKGEKKMEKRSKRENGQK